MDTDELELHVIFSGRVQGVFFRKTTKEIAESLHIKGTVKNLSDGTVEVRAQGTHRHLQLLVQKLQEEFHLDPENSASLNYSDPKEPFEGFEIIYD